MLWLRNHLKIDQSHTRLYARYDDAEYIWLYVSAQITKATQIDNTSKWQQTCLAAAMSFDSISFSHWMSMSLYWEEHKLESIFTAGICISL